MTAASRMYGRDRIQFRFANLITLFVRSCEDSRIRYSRMTSPINVRPVMKDETSLGFRGVLPIHNCKSVVKHQNTEYVRSLGKRAWHNGSEFQANSTSVASDLGQVDKFRVPSTSS